MPKARSDYGVSHHQRVGGVYGGGKANEHLVSGTLVQQASRGFLDSYRRPQR